MPGELPFLIKGKVVFISQFEKLAYVKVSNRNIYYLFSYTPGIDFDKLEIGMIIELEITTMLSRVLSAKII